MSYHAKFQQDKDGVWRLAMWADTPRQASTLRDFFGRPPKGVAAKLLTIDLGRNCWGIYADTPGYRPKFRAEPIVEGTPPDFGPESEMPSGPIVEWETAPGGAVEKETSSEVTNE